MTFIVIKMKGETNCRKYLLPKLRLIFDRGKEIWSFPTSTLRWKHENALQIINSLCNMYGLYRNLKIPEIKLTKYHESPTRLTLVMEIFLLLM